MSQKLNPTPEAVLFDLDGVFFVGNQLITGGAETLNFLKSRQIPCRFTTNTTTMSLESLHKKLLELGLPIRKEEIFSAPVAAVQYLRSLGSPPCYLLLADDIRRDFQEFPTDNLNPKVVVIGDIGESWNYSLLNELFQLVFQGAEILALHKGKYWQVESGLKMDIGVFIAGLEYVTGKQATIVGKPAKTFFDLVLADLRVPAGRAVMVGDDLDNDIAGAQNAGIDGILVKTGKYRKEASAQSSVKPDVIIESVAELPDLF